MDEDDQVIRWVCRAPQREGNVLTSPPDRSRRPSRPFHASAAISLALSDSSLPERRPRLLPTTYTRSFSLFAPRSTFLSTTRFTLAASNNGIAENRLHRPRTGRGQDYNALLATYHADVRPTFPISLSSASDVQRSAPSSSIPTTPPSSPTSPAISSRNHFRRPRRSIQTCFAVCPHRLRPPLLRQV